MERLKALQTPLIIVGLIIVFGLLSAVWSSIADTLVFSSGGSTTVAEAEEYEAPAEPMTPEDVVIDINGILYTTADDYLFNIEPIRELDDTAVSSVVILPILAAVVIGGIVVVGLLIMLLVRIGDRSTANLKEDESYQASLAAIENAQKEYVKSNKAQSPPRDKRTSTDAQPLRWSAISTGLLIVVLAYWFGVVVGAQITEGLAATMGQIFAVTAGVVSVFVLRPDKMLHVDDTSNDETPRGTLWVMLTGAVVLGLGMGFMFAVINGQDPFPFLDGAWWQEFIIGPLTS